MANILLRSNNPVQLQLLRLWVASRQFQHYINSLKSACHYFTKPVPAPCKYLEKTQHFETKEYFRYYGVLHSKAAFRPTSISGCTAISPAFSQLRGISNDAGIM